ncbi:CaiB/BaiF CoA transferase family protein [Nocardia neocaledoniensis]|uniref:CaiB/BaiF CoA transferase family protein n=1 Tax=Nocardia neocaledoniensis TaxID=236511 RepID=UPI002458C4D3|nr:CoA transferase [Nocardia neocaledoniensis]
MPDITPDHLPLYGITVIDFGQYIAAPGATQTLADLGAEVIKVENPRGDQARSIGSYGDSIMRAYNRRKKSVVVDLKSETGLAQARALIRTADIVVSNLRPGAMDRLGLTIDAIRALNPSVIYAEVTGFGKNGPSRQRVGLDIAAQAESGLMYVTGEPDREPQRVGVPVIDHAAAYVLAQALLASLFRRERTGAGDHIEVSLLDVALDLQSVNWGDYSVGRKPVRQGNGQAAAAPAADLFPTADGSIVVSAYTDDKFAALCTLAGLPGMSADPRFRDNARRVANRTELLAALRPFFAPLATEDAVALLTDAGIVSGAVRSYDQARAAEDVVASGIFVQAIDPDGERYTIPGLPYQAASVPRTGDGGGVPPLGSDSERILSSLVVD